MNTSDSQARPSKFVGQGSVDVFTDDDGNLTYELVNLNTAFDCGAQPCCKGEALPHCGMQGDPNP